MTSPKLRKLKMPWEGVVVAEADDTKDAPPSERCAALWERLTGERVEWMKDERPERFWLMYERRLERSEQLLRAVFVKGTAVPPYDPDDWRADISGALMQFCEYGKRSKYGWE